MSGTATCNNISGTMRQYDVTIRDSQFTQQHLRQHGDTRKTKQMI
jgi:hypothetical protein